MIIIVSPRIYVAICLRRVKVIELNGFNDLSTKFLYDEKTIRLI